MTKKNSVIRAGAMLLTAFVLMTFAVECRAFFYRPAAALSIVSEYAALNDSAPPHTQVWKVVPEAASDGSATLRFFMEAASGTDAVCELCLPPAGADGVIRWRGMGNSAEKTSESGLLLTPGFPAPCDVLPLGESNEGRRYLETSQAGGSLFTRSYLVSAESFSLAEAKAQGWIRGEAPGTADLIMITAADEQGRLALRQLWSVDGSWWLYEQTPLRRSWLLY
jgi:hypothetical protein